MKKVIDCQYTAVPVSAAPEHAIKLIIFFFESAQFGDCLIFSRACLVSYGQKYESLEQNQRT